MAKLSKVTTAIQVIAERDQLKDKLKSNNEMIEKTTLQHEQNNKRIKAKVEHLEVRNEELEANTEKLEANNEKLEADNDKLISENDLMKSEFERLRLENLELKKQVEDKEEVPVQSSKTCSTF